MCCVYIIGVVVEVMKGRANGVKMKEEIKTERKQEEYILRLGLCILHLVVLSINFDGFLCRNLVEGVDNRTHKICRSPLLR